jgi:hypothetical protein
MKTTVKIAALLAVAAVIICGAFWLVTRDGGFPAGQTVATEVRNEPAEPDGAAFDPANLPENVFDAEVAIPGTSVSLSYPARGFYGLGVAKRTFTNGDNGSSPEGVRLGVTVPYDPEKGSEFVTVDAMVVRSLSSGETIEDYVDALLSSLDKNSNDYQYMKAFGQYRNINSHDFFTYKVTESVWYLSASTIVNGKVINISLAYTPTDGAESKAAYENNDQLFLQILSHLKFE